MRVTERIKVRLIILGCVLIVGAVTTAIVVPLVLTRHNTPPSENTNNATVSTPSMFIISSHVQFRNILKIIHRYK